MIGEQIKTEWMEAGQPVSEERCQVVAEDVNSITVRSEISGEESTLLRGHGCDSSVPSVFLLDTDDFVSVWCHAESRPPAEIMESSCWGRYYPQFVPVAPEEVRWQPAWYASDDGLQYLVERETLLEGTTALCPVCDKVISEGLHLTLHGDSYQALPLIPPPVGPYCSLTCVAQRAEECPSYDDLTIHRAGLRAFQRKAKEEAVRLREREHPKPIP